MRKLWGSGGLILQVSERCCLPQGHIINGKLLAVIRSLYCVKVELEVYTTS